MCIAPPTTLGAVGGIVSIPSSSLRRWLAVPGFRELRACQRGSLSRPPRSSPWHTALCEVDLSPAAACSAVYTAGADGGGCSCWVTSAAHEEKGYTDGVAAMAGCLLRRPSHGIV